MQVPHLHEVLLAGVDVGEVVNHLAGLDLEPAGVGLVLDLLARQDGVGGDGQAGGAGDDRSGMEDGHCCNRQNMKEITVRLS